MRNLLLSLTLLIFWAGGSFAQNEKVRQANSREPVMPMVFQGNGAETNEVITASDQFLPHSSLSFNLPDFKPENTRATTIIDPAGDGGFENGATFEAN